MTPVGKRARPGTAAGLAPHQINRLLRAAERIQAQDSAGGARTSKRAPSPWANLIRVRNDSGADRGIYDILGLDAPLYGPGDNPREYAVNVTMKGVAPADAHRGRFVVLQESIPDGKLGWAALDGMTHARVLMVATDTSSYPRRYADVIEADCAKLRGRTTGGAEILWAQDEANWTDNVAECIVKLGIHPPSPIPHVVKVKQVGGSAGDNDDPCSFTYDIWAYNGDTADDTERLATGLTPENRSTGTFPDGKYLAPTTGTKGLAHYDPDTDAWALLDVWHERFDTSEDCGS